MLVHYRPVFLWFLVRVGISKSDDLYQDDSTRRNNKTRSSRHTDMRQLTKSEYYISGSVAGSAEDSVSNVGGECAPANEEYAGGADNSIHWRDYLDCCWYAVFRRTR